MLQLSPAMAAKLKLQEKKSNLGFCCLNMGNMHGYSEKYQVHRFQNLHTCMNALTDGRYLTPAQTLSEIARQPNYDFVNKYAYLANNASNKKYHA